MASKTTEAEEGLDVDHSMDPVGPSHGGKFTGAKEYAYLAIIPIVCLVTSVCVGLPLSGYYELKDGPGGYDFKDLMGAATPSKVLVWSGFVGLCVNICLIRFHKVLSLTDSLMTWINGMKLFLPPILILLHAWAIGAVVKELMMPQYIVASMGSSIPKQILPLLVFVFAGIISFSTGSSWGTMAALFPMVVPLAWEVGGQSQDELNKSMASILAGAVFGDHCSPVSDSTILSALSSNCAIHMHVQTQLPYSLAVALITTLFGSLLNGLGLNEWACLPIIWLLIALFVRVVGSHLPDYSPEHKRHDQVNCAVEDSDQNSDAVSAI